MLNAEAIVRATVCLHGVGVALYPGELQFFMLYNVTQTIKTSASHVT